MDKIDKLFSRYNVLISEQGYDQKYGLHEKEMLVINGIDKVREIIGKNRERKKRKISNNKIPEIYNISPLELLKHQEHFRIMGSDRNSYSKTDLEATFMHMKDDHMMNDQLKPGYNVQIAVENYFVIDTYVSNDRTDYNTLIPVLEKHKNNFRSMLEEVTADSGYCCEQNLRYLDQENIKSYIKLQTHEKMKARAYKKEIGKHYNMIKLRDKNGSCYLCSNARKLTDERTETRKARGFVQSFEVYASADRSGFALKADCLYRYDEKKDLNKNKLMKINETWEYLKAKSHKNILSERSILNRRIRSIQTEGHFGDIKGNEGFRRFNYRGTAKVDKEFLLFAFGRNINKYHRFTIGKIQEFEEKNDQIAA